MDTEDLDLVRGVRVTIREDASAFSYSILISATFGAANLVTGALTIPWLFLFVLGATLGFTIAEAGASRLFSVRIREEPGDVVVLGTALAPVSVTLSLGVAVGLLHVLPAGPGWFLAPLAATLTYLGVAGLQMTVARRAERRNPPDEEEGDGQDDVDED